MWMLLELWFDWEGMFGDKSKTVINWETVKVAAWLVDKSSLASNHIEKLGNFLDGSVSKITVWDHILLAWELRLIKNS